MSKKNKLKQQTSIKHFLYHNTNRVLLWLEQNKGLFNVGDIVNTVTASGRRETYKDGCLKRWKVVFIDELGMPYVRRISRRRGYVKNTGSSMFGVTQFDKLTPSALKYWKTTDFFNIAIFSVTLDEGYISALMLDEKFDPRAEYKAKRGTFNASK